MGGDEPHETPEAVMRPEGPEGLGDADAGAEILYDHYKECLSGLATQIRLRLRLLVFLLVVLGVMVVDTLTPESRQSLPELLLRYQGDFEAGDIDIPQHILVSLLWFLLGSLVSLMNQKSLLIEERSNYTRQIEARLDQLFGGGWIYKMRIPTRPTYLKVANLFYFLSYVFILTAGCLLVLYDELHHKWVVEPEARPFFVFDLLVFLLFICGSLGRFMIDFRILISQRPGAPVAPTTARAD